MEKNMVYLVLLMFLNKCTEKGENKFIKTCRKHSISITYSQKQQNKFTKHLLHVNKIGSSRRWSVKHTKQATSETYTQKKERETRRMNVLII